MEGCMFVLYELADVFCITLTVVVCFLYALKVCFYCLFV
jgi:hypothetical protein